MIVYTVEYGSNDDSGGGVVEIFSNIKAARAYVKKHYGEYKPSQYVTDYWFRGVMDYVTIEQWRVYDTVEESEMVPVL